MFPIRLSMLFFFPSAAPSTPSSSFLFLLLFLRFSSLSSTPWYVKPLPELGEFKAGREEPDCALDGVDLGSGMFEHPCEKGSELAQIYCHGKIIEAINFWGHSMLFQRDSKHFVDRPLNRPAKQIIEEFAQTFGDPKKLDVRRMDVDKLAKFVRDNFGQADGVLEDYLPEDWIPNPPYFERIKDPTLRSWAMELNWVWKELGRKMPKELKNSSDHSYIFVPHPFVVPGGRFREFYYWDTYWIARGLIASGMTKTVKHMCQNFAAMIRRFGFVPNGGRIYYNKRSQPPMLALMVQDYYNATGDIEFLQEILPILEQELNHWRQNRTVLITNHKNESRSFYRYWADSNVPRPEAFCQDVRKARGLRDPKDKAKFWRELAAAAESGWDFSSRWMIGGNGTWDLVTLQTTNILPADLNALICGNLEILSKLFLQIGDKNKSAQYREDFEQFRRQFHELFYHEEDGVWYDYILDSGKLNRQYHGSAAIPLFVQCYEPKNGTNLAERMLEWMERQKKPVPAMGYPFGVPVSTLFTGQQWDFPNIWPPMTHLLIEGLRKSSDIKMQNKAKRLARQWVSANYRIYENCGHHMWEKLAATEGTPGNGGEYLVQIGFGWTNGAVLDLLVTYGDELFLDEMPNVKCAQKQLEREPKIFPAEKSERMGANSDQIRK